MSRYYYLLADRLRSSGRTGQAAEVLLLSIEIQPLPPAYNRLARIAVEREQYEQAGQYFRQSLQLDAGQAHVHTNLGQITARFLEQPARALDHFQTGISIESQAGSRVRRLDCCNSEAT